MHPPKDEPEAEESARPNASGRTIPRPLPACMILADDRSIISSRKPPVLWRKSTHYWISLVSLFFATVLAIVAFSIRTSYRGSVFLDRDHLPILFYGAAVFIGAVPLTGVCALFRYEADLKTGWVLFSTILLSFLSLGPIFIFSLDNSDSATFMEDRTSAGLAYMMATFCVMSSIALCIAAGITYFIQIGVHPGPGRINIKNIIASVTRIASLGAFISTRQSKRSSKVIPKSPTLAKVISATPSKTTLSSPSSSKKDIDGDTTEGFSPV